MMLQDFTTSLELLNSFGNAVLTCSPRVFSCRELALSHWRSKLGGVSQHLVRSMRLSVFMDMNKSWAANAMREISQVFDVRMREDVSVCNWTRIVERGVVIEGENALAAWYWAIPVMRLVSSYYRDTDHSVTSVLKASSTEDWYYVVDKAYAYSLWLAMSGSKRARKYKRHEVPTAVELLFSHYDGYVSYLEGEH